MANQYRTANSIIDGALDWIMAIPDDPADFRVIGSPSMAEFIKTKAQDLGEKITKEFLEDNSGSSYETKSDWIDSDRDFESLVEYLQDFYDEGQLDQTDRGLLNTKIGRSRRNMDVGTIPETDADAPIEFLDDPENHNRRLKDLGLEERYREPGMGYGVPDDWEDILKSLAGESDGADSVPEVLPDVGKES